MERIALLAGLLAVATVLPSQGAGPTEIAALADRQGCTTCHQGTPRATSAPAPIAPSWEEIASRYRGVPDARERLTRVVVGGTDGRHWPETEFKFMLPSERALRPDQTREIVRWILER